MAPRFSRPRLIDESDKQYRAFVAQIMLTKDNQRAIRPPRNRDLFGGEAEAALRSWLAQRYTLSDRRIVEYLEHRGRSAIKKYRELDAVVLPEPKIIQVFEIKASQRATSLRRASQQLRDTRTILSMLFGRVYTTILLVDTGIPKTPEEAAEQLRQLLELREDMQRDPPPLPPTLDEVLANLPHVRQIATLDEQLADQHTVSLLRVGVDDIIALAGAENLHLDWDEELDEIEDEPEEGEKSRYAYTTDEPKDDDDDDDDNPLAAALRKAMKG